MINTKDDTANDIKENKLTRFESTTNSIQSKQS